MGGGGRGKPRRGGRCPAPGPEPLEGQAVARVVVGHIRGRVAGGGPAVEELDLVDDQLGLVAFGAVLLPAAGLEAATDVEQRALLDQVAGDFGLPVKLSRLVAQPTRLQNGT